MSTEAGDKLEQYRLRALDFQEAGRLPEALDQLELAWSLLAIMPDSEIRQLSRFGFDRDALENRIAALKRRIAATASAGGAVTSFGALVVDPEHGDPLEPL